jgi:peroxiredoxin Q/BCP
MKKTACRMLVAAVIVGTLSCSLGCSKGDAKAKDPVSLQVGSSITDLPIPGGSKSATSLAELGKTGFVLVYFYPKDGTPGCTKQACALRDSWDKLAQAGVSVVGVSRNSQEQHQKFAEKHVLPFPLVADEDGTWGESFGVKKTFGMYSRVSYLLSSELKVVRIYSDVDPGLHAGQILKDLELKE